VENFTEIIFMQYVQNVTKSSHTRLRETEKCKRTPVTLSKRYFCWQYCWENGKRSAAGSKITQCRL